MCKIHKPSFCCYATPIFSDLLLDEFHRVVKNVVLGKLLATFPNFSFY
jgi:hypothetical protein